jgi:hypothetical protein
MKSPEKDTPVGANVNTNNNTNNVNVNVKIEHPKKRSNTKKSKSNWLKKAIVGGLIAVAVSVAIYYLTVGTGNKSRLDVPASQHKVEPMTSTTN